MGCKNARESEVSLAFDIVGLQLGGSHGGLLAQWQSVPDLATMILPTELSRIAT